MKNENLLPLTPVLILNNNFEKQSTLFIDHEKQLIYQPLKTNITWIDCVYQHLYLTSKREIKEGEYYLRYNLRNEITGIYKYIVGTSVPDDLDRKIELTTDPILISDEVPEIPQSFLEEYVKKYNHNGKEVDMDKLAKDILRRRGALHILGEPIFQREVRFYTEESVLSALNEALQSHAREFTLEDMKKCYNQSRFDGNAMGKVLHPEIKDYLNFEDYIQSLTTQEKGTKRVWVELHPRPITVGHTELGEEGKDWYWSVEPYNAEPKIYFHKL